MSVLNISDYMTLGIIAKGRNPVFKVRNLYSGKEYALKKVKRADYTEHLSDFQEVLYVSSCIHPNILRILGFSLSQARSQCGNEYIVNILMDLMQKDLAQEIRDRQKTNSHFQKTEMIKITVSLVSALEFMQKKRKLAHRDLKPENILLNQEGEIFLADFGDSFLKTDMKQSARTLVGSPYYMSPELKEMYIAGDITEDFKYDPWKSDVYALGMTLYDAACLRLGQKTSKVEGFKQISELYGEDFADLLKTMLEDNIESRLDFVQLVNHPLFLQLSTSKNEEKLKIYEEEKKTVEMSEDKKQSKQMKTSEKLYNFIEKLPKNSKINRFYKILAEIKKIEGEKEEKAPNFVLNTEEASNDKVPEDYFKYFDCQ